MIRGIPWSLIYCTVETGFGSPSPTWDCWKQPKRALCLGKLSALQLTSHMEAQTITFLRNCCKLRWFYAPKRHLGTNMGRRIDNVIINESRLSEYAWTWRLEHARTSTYNLISNTNRLRVWAVSQPPLPDVVFQNGSLDGYMLLLSSWHIDTGKETTMLGEKQSHKKVNATVVPRGDLKKRRPDNVRKTLTWKCKLKDSS